jgi:D-xylonolactonase
MWSPRENALYWVDILGLAVHRIALGGGAPQTWVMPEMIGWIVEREHQAGFIAGFASGFAELWLDPVIVRPIGDPEPERICSRMNDAKVDSEGCIWAGTMDCDGASPVVTLYRLDRNHQWRVMDRGYFVTNGPTFSPDGRYLYHTDSVRRVIYRFEFDPDGGQIHKAPFIVFEESWGLPDGMTTDVEGCLWIAHWGGGRVSRFTPQGQLIRSKAIPASLATNCVFGGEHLDRMFVTSAAHDRPEEEFAGELFEIETGIRGLPALPFAG